MKKILLSGLAFSFVISACEKEDTVTSIPPTPSFSYIKEGHY